MSQSAPTLSFQPFELERYQNKWENRVSYNLAESGVLPLTLSELIEITGTDRAEVDNLPLGYGQTDGSDELKDAVASLYPGAGRENVLITVGSSEANFVTTWTLASAGRHVAVLTPTYKQAWGLAENLGAHVSSFELDEDANWKLDQDSARQAITTQTDLVVVTNPNNPTGYVLSEKEMDLLVNLSGERDAWLVVDEVYRGAERSMQLTPTFWGRGDKIAVVGGLSKAYGLPGLRIGWVVGPAHLISDISARHDYTVIGASSLADLLATRALQNANQLWQRARGIVRDHFVTLDTWLSQHSQVFSWTPPACGAICFPGYTMKVDSFEFVEYLRKNQSVLLVPGSHFDRANHLRIGFGYHRESLQKALDLVSEAIARYV